VKEGLQKVQEENIEHIEKMIEDEERMNEV